MKCKKVWRYYCEFCKKSGGHKYWMERHEGGCTINPGRICGMCSLVGNYQAPIEELKNIILKYICKDTGEIPFVITNLIVDEKKTLAELREKTNNCPACILAAIRQSDLSETQGINFNFKDERDRFFEEYNAENQYGYY